MAISLRSTPRALAPLGLSLAVAFALGAAGAALAADSSRIRWEEVVSLRLRKGAMAVEISPEDRRKIEQRLAELKKSEAQGTEGQELAEKLTALLKSDEARRNAPTEPSGNGEAVLYVHADGGGKEAPRCRLFVSKDWAVYLDHNMGSVVANSSQSTEADADRPQTWADRRLPRFFDGRWDHAPMPADKAEIGASNGQLVNLPEAEAALGRERVAKRIAESVFAAASPERLVEMMERIRADDPEIRSSDFEWSDWAFQEDFGKPWEGLTSEEKKRYVVDRIENVGYGFANSPAYFWNQAKGDAFAWVTSGTDGPPETPRMARSLLLALQRLDRPPQLFDTIQGKSGTIRLYHTITSFYRTRWEFLDSDAFFIHQDRLIFATDEWLRVIGVDGGDFRSYELPVDAHGGSASYAFYLRDPWFYVYGVSKTDPHRVAIMRAKLDQFMK